MPLNLTTEEEMQSLANKYHKFMKHRAAAGGQLNYENRGNRLRTELEQLHRSFNSSDEKLTPKSNVDESWLYNNKK